MYWEALACGVQPEPGKPRFLRGAWVKARGEQKRHLYFNGGYWGVPVEWFVYTLDLVDSRLADKTFRDMVADYKKRGVNEWVCGEEVGVPCYPACAALPLAGVRRMVTRRRDAESAGSQQQISSA